MEHTHIEREKLNQLESTQETTKVLKALMNERKKKLENQAKIRLRDFYVIYGYRRPKLFTFILKLVANVVPEQY